MKRNTLVTSLIFSIGLFSGSALANPLSQCKVTMLPSSKTTLIQSKHNSHNGIIGHITYNYKVICKDAGYHEILISKNQYAGEENTIYSSNRDILLKLTSNDAIINRNGYSITLNGKDGTVSNTFEVFSKVPTNFIENQSFQPLINPDTIVTIGDKNHPIIITYNYPGSAATYNKGMAIYAKPCILNYPSHIDFGRVNPRNLS